MPTETAVPLRSWMRAAPAYTRKYHSATIEGVSREFYPISTELVFMLRAVAKPLGKALSFMQGGEDHDRKFVQHVETDKGDGRSFNHIEQDPITVELATFRAAQRSKAIDELAEAISGDEVRGLLGMLVLDSMRPRNDEVLPSQAEGLGWIARTDIVELSHYLKAFYEANKEVLGPLVSPFAGAKAALVAKVAATLQTGSSAPSGSPPSSAETASPSSADEKPSPTPLPVPEPVQG